MPPEVLVYTTAFCGYCVRTKSLLEGKGVTYEERDVTSDAAARRELVERTGRRTLPQIFIDGESIGGFDELESLDVAGKLDELLSAD